MRKLFLVAVIVIAGLGAHQGRSQAAGTNPVGAVVYPAPSYALGLNKLCLFYPTTSQPDVCLTNPPAGAGDGVPEWAPDGTAVAFIRSSNLGNQIDTLMTVDLRGHVKDMSSPYGVWNRNFAWSPDSSELVFRNTAPVEEAGLIVVNRQTRLKTLIPGSIGCWEAQWKSSNWIIALCGGHGFGQLGIYRASPDGAGPPELVVPLVEQDSSGYDHLTLSPSGQKAALFTWVKHGVFTPTPTLHLSIQVYDIEDPSNSAYGIYSYPDQEPGGSSFISDVLRWSPDSSRLVFDGVSLDSNGSPTWGIYFYPADGLTPPVNQTAHLPDEYRFFDWAPSGCTALIGDRRTGQLGLSDAAGHPTIMLDRYDYTRGYRWSPALSPHEPICTASSLGSITYIASGDSIPDGEDLGGCPRGTNCKAKAYPQYFAARIAGAMQPLYPVTSENIACSGFTTSQFIAKRNCPGNGITYPKVVINGSSIQSQLGQVLAPVPDLKIVSVTVGADNLLNVLAEMGRTGRNLGCITGPQDEQICERLIQPILDQVRDDLYRIVGPLQTQPGTLVVVTGYYHIFNDFPVDPGDPQHGLAIRRINAYVDRLNATIADVVHSYNSSGVRFVDLVDRFNGHTFHPWESTASDWLIVSPECRNRENNFNRNFLNWLKCEVFPGVHPNEEGQRQIAAEIWDDVGWWIVNGLPR